MEVSSSVDFESEIVILVKKKETCIEKEHEIIYLSTREGTIIIKKKKNAKSLPKRKSN